MLITLNLSSLFLCVILFEVLTRIQNGLEHIYSRITANLLTLNCSKTELLLIGLTTTG